MYDSTDKICQSRQALCETATWFRAYQGGVYFSKGIAYGYLLGSFSSQSVHVHHVCVIRLLISAIDEMSGAMVASS